MLLPLSLTFVLLQAPAAQTPGPVALKGLDPVALVQGRERAGDPARTLEHEGQLYVFADEANQQRFQSDPARYAIQLAGGCARMGPLSGICDAGRFAVHGERIYLFASDQCRTAFLAAPERFLDREDPPLEGDEAQRKAGRALVQRMLLGLGGAKRVDAVQTLRWDKHAREESGGKTYATRASALYRFPDDLRKEAAWDDSASFDVETPEDGFKGPKAIATLHPAARAEVRRQLGHETLYLARQRADADFEAVAGAPHKVGSDTCETLIVRHGGTRTTLYVEPVNGRVLRAAWRGRLAPGAIGDVVVDYADFRQIAGLELPHARQVSFDGKPVASLSGALDVLEVDAEMPDTLFTR